MKASEAQILKYRREKMNDVLGMGRFRRTVSVLALGAIILSACTVNPGTETAGTEVPPTSSAVIETAEVTATPEQSYSEIVVEGVTGVKPEFLLNGNLEVNQEMGEKFYTEFLDALARNEQNRDYMVALLGQNPDGAKLLDYLKNNDYIMPAGLNLPYRIRPGYVRIGRNPIAEEIKLDTVKGVAFGPNEWNGNTAGITDYVNALKTYAGLWVTDSTYTCQYLGWGIDPEDNRLVLVAGAKTLPPVEQYPRTEGVTIGGRDGSFVFDRDAKLALGDWLQIIKLLETYRDNSGTAWQAATPFGCSCDMQETSGVCDDDVEEFLGGSENHMFIPGR
jgi:hypothetical protein